MGLLLEVPPAHRFVSIRRGTSERTLVVLSPDDRREYLRLAAVAAPTIETSLGPLVIANRVALARIDPPALALRPWRVERRAFAVALRRLASSHRTLVFADVAACYPSIEGHRVGHALRALGCRTADEVERFLERTSAAGIPGLPVGPAPSALFANAVLGHVDLALGTRGHQHLRWVDDLVVGVRGPGDADAVLRALAEVLAEIGLRLNEGKTRVVVDPGALVAAPSVLRGPRIRLR